MADNSHAKNTKTPTFRERLGRNDIEMGDFKVDDLRKIASEYSISGSHGMNKQELIDTINQARRNQVR
jgi:hypothetical protein